MGSGNPGAALVRVTNAIHAWAPQVVIGVGVGFGCRPEEHRFGDVLVSKQIQCYESQRVNTRAKTKGAVALTLRGDRVTSSTDWLRMVRSTDNARERDTPHWPKLRFGLLLSGEKLIDNASFRDQLVLATGGEAIGGEMEAAGIYVACAENRCDWLIVKAISDWADGRKAGTTSDEKKRDDERQRAAAANAATVVWAALRGDSPVPPLERSTGSGDERVEHLSLLPEPRYDSADVVEDRHVRPRGSPGRLRKQAAELFASDSETELATEVVNAADTGGRAPGDASVDAFEYLLTWLARADAAPLFALLGEYGMGKTVTCQRLAQEVNRRFREQQPGAGSRPALYFDLRDLTQLRERVPTLNEILTECIARNWRRPDGEPALTPHQVHERVREGALVIFDGLDEVLVHYDEAPGQAFTRELLSLLPRPQVGQKKTRARLLVSCRTHFFRSLREQTTHFTGEDRSDKTAEAFEAMTLLPFSDEQVREYLAKAVPGADVAQLIELIESVHNLPELAQRPYTLSLIADHVPALERRRAAGQPIYGITLYREMVQSWLERDKGKQHLKPEHKLRLAAHLAATLWRQGQRLMPAIRLEAWFSAWLAEQPDIARRYAHVTPDKLDEDLRNSTFLVRVDGESDAQSGFRFAHSSMQEYFVAQYLFDAAAADRPQDWAMPVPSVETL
ncbi:MAG TPA: NACHT domain-containing protein, partial [Burkholderiaceae bacterium]|nr:NACHT domain-containing protein [Burkholderiaceae bacterium]